MPAKAFHLFHKMSYHGCQPNLITYNTLLDSLCRHDEPHTTRSLLDSMQIKRFSGTLQKKLAQLHPQSRIIILPHSSPSTCRITKSGATFRDFPSISLPIFKMSLIPRDFGFGSSIIDPFPIDRWDAFNGFDPFPLDRWDPFDRFGFAFDNLLSLPGVASGFSTARIDWRETPKAHVFKADIPGLKMEEVKIVVGDDNVLQISGERSREQGERTDTWYRAERSSGKFLRRFRLPEKAKMDQIEAAMEDGVLTITVPKDEVKKPAVRSIEISG
ncbi:putative 18.2 kDa class I heat shock protein [Cocos nucifera]|uniref:Putative 18.2 kDa class I heat shock protein n=1 Tax=Cocos nucifera TaxID=13894 RepID=A0A8K0INH0_COCNU|nr:putative 18.2 kDa class I heat shock protein [Cocos nucifera]